MILRLLLKAESQARNCYLYTEHVCAVGYAASEGWPEAHLLVQMASAALMICLLIYCLFHSARRCHRLLVIRRQMRRIDRVDPETL